MGDLFVDNGRILTQFSNFCFGLGSHFIGCLEGVVKTFLYFLDKEKGTSPSVLV